MTTITLVSARQNMIRAEIFKALGHPARLTMVDELRNGERCVCELRKLVDLDVSTVSKHLSVLKGAGIVSCRKQGNWVWYALELSCLDNFLSCLDSFLNNQQQTNIK